MRKIICIVLTGLSLTLAGSLFAAEEQKKPVGPPPMLVTTTAIVSGTTKPTAPFVGTLYFARTAEVASEVDGIVRQVYVDDGQAVKSGDRLARLDDALLLTEISGTTAVFEQNQIEMEQAQRDYERITALHQQESIATSEYEAYGTKFNRLQKQAAVLKARLDRSLLEQKKKTVRAPFDGIIIENLVEPGEWVKAGGVVATLADNRNFEVRIDIPADIIANLTPGQEILAKVAEQKLSGHFTTIIPRGDISTRTFTAKFKLKGNTSLVEGMQARIDLPVAIASESLLVPRDAVIKSRGEDVVFINDNGVAKMVSVKIAGHSGTLVGIISSEIEENQSIIVKGNERIRDGQSVRTE
jgi:RND family efflux transporter MFP subunit